MRCVRIGPLPSGSAGLAEDWLKSERVEHSRRHEERKVESSYWVHLGPFENRKQAEKRLKEIERLGIQDLFIMQDKRGGTSISLGLFSQSENASKRMQELADKGITAQQEVRYKTDQLIWFDVRMPEPADATVTRLRDRDWGAGAEIQDQACPTTPPPR